MADSLSTNLNASIDWLFKSPQNMTTIADSSKAVYSGQLASGNGADQADKLWSDQRTVNAGANDDLDLTALAHTIFGGTVTVNMAKVKAILVVNLSKTAGDVLRLDSTVANAFLGHLGGASGSKPEIGPDSPGLFANKKDGWATDNTHKILRVANPGANAISYQIVILGTS